MIWPKSLYISNSPYILLNSIPRILYWFATLSASNCFPQGVSGICITDISKKWLFNQVFLLSTCAGGQSCLIFESLKHLTKKHAFHFVFLQCSIAVAYVAKVQCLWSGIQDLGSPFYLLCDQDKLLKFSGPNPQSADVSTCLVVRGTGVKGG